MDNILAFFELNLIHLFFLLASRKNYIGMNTNVMRRCLEIIPTELNEQSGRSTYREYNFSFLNELTAIKQMLAEHPQE